MKVISLNVNGIRASAKKGLFSWLQLQNADVLCLQEIKAQEQQLNPETFKPKGWHVEYFSAQRKGYSGVAIYSKLKPNNITRGINSDGWQQFNDEGRYIQADFADLSIASFYMPSGSAKAERQNYKYQVMADLEPILKAKLNDGRKHIICGDFNIAHKKIDLKNWRSNQKNSGFLPEERAWLDKVFYEIGWLDAFRVLNQQEYQYTWWSNRGQAWTNNTGWRLDYQIISQNLKTSLVATDIFKKLRFSDHAPLIIDYKI